MPRHLGTLIGAIDQGTSSTRFLVFQASTGDLITYHQIEMPKIYPKEGWVEQDPMRMIKAIRATMEEVIVKLKKLDINPNDVTGIGLCNQRETTIVWDKETGIPIYNAIVWLDNRTTGIVDHFLDAIPGRDINFHKPKTGLPLSTYFSAFKLKWLIDNIPEIKTAIDEGRALFGTVDSWIMYNLLDVHRTDVTNASRTFLYDIENLRWSNVMCKFFNVPMDILPEVQPSGSIFGTINWRSKEGPFIGVPISAVIGDQSAALVGQNCMSVGSTKATFGTGCFILQNIGAGTMSAAMKGVPKEARTSLITTIGYQLKDKPVVYALEGSVAIAGAAITWLRDNLELINEYKDVEPLARSVKDSGGVFFVPAFQGLYAPYWDPNAAGVFIGLSGFTRKAHVIRATLEAIAYQTVDILSLMRRDASGMMIDGGMACNDLLCQILADFTGIEIVRPATIEATALGAAMISGNTLGHWDIHDFATGCAPDGYNNQDNNDPLSKLASELDKRSGRPPGTPTDRSRTNTGVGDRPRLTKRESIMNFIGLGRPNIGKTESLMRTISVSMSRPEPKYPAGSEVFKSTVPEEKRAEMINCWRLAIERCMKWTKIKYLEDKRVDYRRRSTIPVGFYLITSFGILMLSNFISPGLSIAS